MAQVATQLIFLSEIKFNKKDGKNRTDEIGYIYNLLEVSKNRKTAEIEVSAMTFFGDSDFFTAKEIFPFQLVDVVIDVALAAGRSELIDVVGVVKHDDDNCICLQLPFAL